MELETFAIAAMFDQLLAAANLRQGDKTDTTSSIAALLIIIYRLRNNLFHGLKWAYNIQGQRSNFAHANYVLMTVLDVHGKLLV